MLTQHAYFLSESCVHSLSSLSYKSSRAMFKTCAIFLLQLVFAQMRFLPVGLNDSTTDNIVEETQHAICKISSADLEATANASITRQLKGVCTTSHLDDRINILEKTLILEMNNVKNLLEQSLNTMYKLEERKKTTNNKMHQIKSLNLAVQNKIDRQSEIVQLNMTMQKEDNHMKFHYYWKIDNFVLSSMNALESGDFYFAGNHVYIRMYPNYLQSEQMFIQIVDLEEFQLSYKFTVLHQEDEELDIMSQLLYCDMLRMQCTGYKISHNILVSRNYIKNNSLIIKLSIYLH